MPWTDPQGSGWIVEPEVGTAGRGRGQKGGEGDKARKKVAQKLRRGRPSQSQPS